MAAALILLEESTRLSTVPASATPQPTHGLARRLADAGCSDPRRRACWSDDLVGDATRSTARRSHVSRARRHRWTASPIAITPDGTRILYISSNRAQLLVRTLDELEPRPLVSGNNIWNPLVSPDGQFVAYTDGNSLMRVALKGGPVTTIAQVDGPVRGATWPDNDTSSCSPRPMRRRDCNVSRRAAARLPS